MRSRVELFEKIRRDRRLDQLSIRELADRHGVHRRTVRQALAAAVPPPRQAYPVRPRPAIDPWVTVIDAWLIGDKDAPRKQRHTARRVWQRLVAEHQATLAEVTVSRYVARRRVELGLLTHEVSIPQAHLAGAEAEVDFGEFYSTIAGVVVKCWMFVMRLSHSGKAFHIAFGTQAQEAFLEGHVLAFEYFGGVAGRIRTDYVARHIIGVLCPAVLCARPPENPAGVAVMARVRAHNEIDGKTIASCPCCRKGSCRHAGEVLREARNG